MRRHDKGSGVGKLIGVAVIVALAISVVSVDILRTPAQQVVHAIGAPISGLGNSIGAALSGFGEGIRSKKDLVEENQSLREELRLMSIKLADRSLLEQENTRLISLASSATSTTRSIRVGVLSGPSRTPYDTVIIDAGIDRGIDVGNRVSVGGVTIGAVREVLAHSAKVELFSSVGVRTGVLVGPEVIPAEAEGRGAGNFSVVLPRDLDVAIGDTVRLPGLTPSLVGTVAVINADPNDAFKQILFHSPISPFTLLTLDIHIK